MLLLKAKATPDSKHGNGIMYGGKTKHFSNLPDFVQEGAYEVFYVETDFGNHITLSWSELMSIFDVVGVRDYERWKADRAELRNQPNLIERQHYMQGIDNAVFNLRRDFP